MRQFLQLILMTGIFFSFFWFWGKFEHDTFAVIVLAIVHIYAFWYVGDGHFIT